MSDLLQHSPGGEQPEKAGSALLLTQRLLLQACDALVWACQSCQDFGSWRHQAQRHVWRCIKQPWSSDHSAALWCCRIPVAVAAQQTPVQNTGNGLRGNAAEEDGTQAVQRS